MKQSTADIKAVQGYIADFKSILPNNRYQKAASGWRGRKVVKYYDIAKESETKHRNLDRAMCYYSRAALNGQKINTCIKDFASVLHQSGMTELAVKFLKEMSPAYEGDPEKYSRLLLNLQMQINPTGKHICKRILLDMKTEEISIPELAIQQMFQNDTRIRQYFCCNDLSLTTYQLPARYMVLTFDSFSAAKKTLETFQESEWFHVDKYWMDASFSIVAEACNGKQDFETGITFKDGVVEKYNGQDVGPEYLARFKAPILSYLKTQDDRERKNQLAAYFIQLKNTLETQEKIAKL